MICKNKLTALADQVGGWPTLGGGGAVLGFAFDPAQ